MTEYKKDESEIGVLWRKDGRKGEYLSGVINGVSVVCFPIQSKSPKAPNWRVLKARPNANTSTPSDADNQTRSPLDEDF